jgi:hypothetical protein
MPPAWFQTIAAGLATIISAAQDNFKQAGIAGGGIPQIETNVCFATLMGMGPLPATIKHGKIAPRVLMRIPLYTLLHIRLHHARCGPMAFRYSRLRWDFP